MSIRPYFRSPFPSRLIPENPSAPGLVVRSDPGVHEALAAVHNSEIRFPVVERVSVDMVDKPIRETHKQAVEINSGGRVSGVKRIACWVRGPSSKTDNEVVILGINDGLHFPARKRYGESIIGAHGSLLAMTYRGLSNQRLGFPHFIMGND